jgi:hypothetical protein
MSGGGGVLLEYADATGAARLGFLPAEIAVRISALGAVRRVPGLRLPAVGIALADGEVVTVFEIGSSAHARASYRPGQDWSVPGCDRAVICNVGGQRLALSGGTIVATGVFELVNQATDPLRGSSAPGGAARWRDVEVPTLDVRALYRAAEAAIWMDRARGRRAAKESQSP